MDILALVLRLALVFGVLVFFYWFATRKTRAKTEPGQRMAIIARQPLTPKAAAVLVETDIKRYLLAVADGHVSVIDTLPIPPDSGQKFSTALQDAEGDQAASEKRGHLGTSGLWVPSSATTPDGPVTPARDSSPGREIGGKPAQGLLRGLSQWQTWRSAANYVLRGKPS